MRNLFKRSMKNVVKPITLTPPVESRVEVELHKGASEEAAKKAKEANAHLTDLLVENGFTLKIYLAAGGQLHKKRSGAK